MRQWWREIVRFFVEGLLDDPESQGVTAQAVAHRSK
jgi:hypothetical protein